MIVPVDSCCDAFLEAHICRDLGSFFVVRRRASRSTRCSDVESSVTIFSQRAIWGGEYISMSIFELRLVDTLYPRGRIFCLRGRLVLWRKVYIIHSKNCVRG